MFNIYLCSRPGTSYVIAVITVVWVCDIMFCRYCLSIV